MAANEARQAGVAALAREIEEFMAAGGWDQPPQLFALVPTAALLDEQPELAGQLDRANPLTPVAQEIIVLPPGSESELPDIAEADAESLRRAAADHPQRTEARLVAAVLRDGEGACVMRLRGIGTAETADETIDEIVESPDLAPNLVEALKATLLP